MSQVKLNKAFKNCILLSEKSTELSRKKKKAQLQHFSILIKMLFDCDDMNHVQTDNGIL